MYIQIIPTQPNLKYGLKKTDGALKVSITK